jgi:hypothetical protein
MMADETREVVPNEATIQNVIKDKEACRNNTLGL